MGGGAATSPLPPVSAEAIAQLTHVMRDLLEEQRRTNRILEKRENPNPWLDQDEAAVMLGQTIKKSGEHRRVLKKYRDAGWLVTFASHKPYRYSRKEVEALAIDFERSYGDPQQKYP